MATTRAFDFNGRVREHELSTSPFWRGLLVAVGRAASAASDEGGPWDDLHRGFDVIETLARSVNKDWWDRTEGQPIHGWYHVSRPTLVKKKRLEPYILLQEVEEGAAGYLALSYRVEALDRLLIDMLMAAEMFAFADEVQPQLNQKLPPVLSWVWGNLKSLVIGLAVAALILWLAPNSSVAQWTAGIIAGLTLLGTALSLVVFPFFYPALRDQRQKFNATVMSMLDAYRTLNGSPASVPHIRKMVDRGTDAGVVWPASMIALLDDIEARRKSI